MHPSLGVDGLGGAIRVVPVALHHRVAAGAQLAPFAPLDRLARVVDDADLDVGVHATHAADAQLEGVVGLGLGRHGRRLGHAVGDGDLVHVHAADDLGHDLDRARRPGHDPGTQGGQVVVGEGRVVEHGDEHRGHAVEAGAALGHDGFEHGPGLERGRRDHDGGAVGGAGQVAEDHPEAVVEGHGDADPVDRRVAAALADEVPVVHDVAMGEGGALREPGGAAGVLDVDGVVGRQRRLGGGELGVGDGVAGGDERVPLRRSQVQHPFEVGSLVTDLGDHGAVVGGLERRRRHQPPAPGLVEHVRELAGAVRRVDADEDHPDPGGGVLEEHPLEVVRAPDAEPVAGLETSGQQRPGDAVDLGVELGVAEPDVLVARHHGVDVGVGAGGGAEVGADGGVEQVDVGRSGRVRDRCHVVVPLASPWCRRSGPGQVPVGRDRA